MTGPAPAVGLTAQAVHHVGITVASLERAITFWAGLLGREPRDHRLLQGPPVGDLVGYPGVRIDSCWFDLPGGVALEVLEYLDRSEPPYDPGTAHPGNVHLCLAVGDLDAALTHVSACGGRPVSPAPVDVRQGPRAGSRLAYVRAPDGVTIELVQPPSVRTG